MKKVTIMSGVSGSGKSTFVARHLPDAFVISADHFFVGADGAYRFDPRLLPAAHADCMRRFVAEVTAGRDHVVVDNTNTTAVEIAPYYSVARAFNAAVQLVRVSCDPAVAAARNRHGVPLASIEAQATRLATLELPPFWDIWVTEVPGSFVAE
jgi:predicted kinase